MVLLSADQGPLVLFRFVRRGSTALFLPDAGSRLELWQGSVAREIDLLFWISGFHFLVDLHSDALFIRFIRVVMSGFPLTSSRIIRSRTLILISSSISFFIFFF